MDEPILVNGDCRPALSGFIAAGRRFKNIITSPPYNAGKDYEDGLSIEEYKSFAASWINLIPSLLTDDGSFWLNVGYIKTGSNQAIPLTYLYHDLCELPMVQEVVWHYEGGMTYRNRFAHRTERWMWFAKDPLKVEFNLNDVRDISLNKTNDGRNHPLGKNPTDYWYYNRVTNNSEQKTIHPCQFPRPMIDRIILACSSNDDVVLDPFMGVGTVGISAKMLGRSFIGIELNTEYFNAAVHRIEITHPLSFVTRTVRPPDPLLPPFI